jgi:hypothetical protein
MLYFVCLLAGVFVTFHSIGVIILGYDNPTDRALRMMYNVALDLLVVVLAAFFMPALVPYLFTFAFTRSIMYVISDVSNVLHVKIPGI